MLPRHLPTLDDYRALVDRVIATHFPDPAAIPKDKMELVDLFKGLDLSPVDTLMADK